MKKRSISKLIFLIGILISSSCSNNLQEIKTFGQEEERPDVVVVNIETTYSEGGKVSAKITAPLANIYTKVSEPYYEFPEGILILFYNDSLIEESSLKADYAIFFEKKQFGIAEKNVIITNNNGDVLKTEELFLDDKSKKIYSEKAVTITSKNGSLTHGESGFESNMNFTAYEFKDVSGEIQIKEDLMQEKND